MTEDAFQRDVNALSTTIAVDHRVRTCGSDMVSETVVTALAMLQVLSLKTGPDRLFDLFIPASRVLRLLAHPFSLESTVMANDSAADRRWIQELEPRLAEMERRHRLQTESAA